MSPCLKFVYTVINTAFFLLLFQALRSLKEVNTSHFFLFLEQCLTELKHTQFVLTTNNLVALECTRLFESICHFFVIMITFSV